jgi:uncharacterized Fe-S cluster-containing MiaB family protein
LIDVYPNTATERDRWILTRRPARNAVDPHKPFAFLLEEERAETGDIVRVATIFLTNLECPWRCLMCDLWKNTLKETVPVGAIPAQIDYALKNLSAQRAPDARQIKLYNSGSFFDPRAIPPDDHPAIAERVRDFERVIVECHPALIGEPVLQFRDLLRATEPGGTSPPPCADGERTALSASHQPAHRRHADKAVRAPERHESDAAGPHASGGQKLEVAMGLETVHPEVLAKLNKRMTLDQFRHAADFLRKHGVALRVFVLVKPPFLDEGEALEWANRSVDFAFDCNATAVSLIPTRPGNGALEALTERGEFSSPKLTTLEAALEYGIGLKRGRVFADLWDLEKFSNCRDCFESRQARLYKMNLEQVVTPRVVCDCGENRHGR